MANIRFMDNNFFALNSPSITVSSEVSGYEATNMKEQSRSKYWLPSGNFTITSSNNLLYVIGASDTTATIPAGNYATPELLATQIQTSLNAVDTLWTCTYDFSGGTYKFTIANSTTATLKLATTTNAAWDTIGYDGALNRTGTSFVADESRIHTDEFISLDFSAAIDGKFFALISPLDIEFPLSETATITLQANNVPVLSSGNPLEETLTRTTGGVFKFNETTYSYRYWKVKIVDVDNPLGPRGLKLSNMYIGDYITFTDRNVNNGFVQSINDLSTSIKSETGSYYFHSKNKYSSFTGVNLSYLDKADIDDLRSMFRKLGTTTPLFISIDPDVNISSTIDELTTYCRITSGLDIKHVIYDKFNVSFSTEELT